MTKVMDDSEHLKLYGEALEKQIRLHNFYVETSRRTGRERMRDFYIEAWKAYEALVNKARKS